MFADHTKLSAQDLARVLHHMMTPTTEYEYFRLETVRYGPDGEEDAEDVFVQPLPTSTENDAVSVLADGTEVVRCLSQDGRRVDIILGKPAEREFQPAQVVFEQPD